MQKAASPRANAGPSSSQLPDAEDEPHQRPFLQLEVTAGPAKGKMIRAADNQNEASVDFRRPCSLYHASDRCGQMFGGIDPGETLCCCAQVLIGRIPTSALPIPDQEISGKHVLISYEARGDVWKVVSGVSDNGYFRVLIPCPRGHLQRPSASLNQT